MDHQRLQIRFRKEGDLRWISHRDLARAFERLFRRANLSLRMSEGFHPHPKINFASALALGIKGTNELVDVDVTQAVNCAQLQQLLTSLAPQGLVIDEVSSVRHDTPKTRAASFVYEIEIPQPRRADAETKISALLESSSHPIERPGRKQPIDLRSGVLDLALVDGVLRMHLAESEAANVKPREVLAALELQDLELEGRTITRTAVLTT